MIKIIDGCAYEGKQGNSYRLRAVEFDNGHFEATACRVVEWTELDWSDLSISNYLEAKDRHLAETELERAEKSARAAARRAQKRVRHVCKAMGANTLCTLTYQALETDLARVKADLKEFNRRVLRVWPEFRFVAAFETQKRGAWHVHLGCPKIPTMLSPRGQAVKVKSWNLLRAIWRSVAKDRRGNFDAQRHRGSARKGPAAIAAYISKYMLKDYAEGTKWGNRYGVYGPVSVPAPLVLGIVPDLGTALDTVYALGLGFGPLRTARLTRFQDAFYLDVEP